MQSLRNALVFTLTPHKEIWILLQEVTIPRQGVRSRTTDTRQTIQGARHRQYPRTRLMPGSFVLSPLGSESILTYLLYPQLCYGLNYLMSRCSTQTYTETLQFHLLGYISYLPFPRSYASTLDAKRVGVAILEAHRCPIVVYNVNTETQG